MFFARPFLASGLIGVFALAGVSTSDANAQQVYRIVAPDGRVTFSDKPPVEGSTRAMLAPAMQSSGESSTANLPFEVRQAAGRYPVTLYTAPGCSACNAGRALLIGRGIPFAERTITTNDDIEALKRLAGAASVPFLTIGGQQIKGFAETEWVQFLDAASYPKASQLPSNYTRSEPMPLVAAQDPQRPTPRTPAETERAAAPAPAPPPAENPAGIKF